MTEKAKIELFPIDFTNTNNNTKVSKEELSCNLKIEDWIHERFTQRIPENGK